jgi:hypothetical protein
VQDHDAASRDWQQNFTSRVDRLARRDLVVAGFRLRGVRPELVVGAVDPAQACVVLGGIVERDPGNCHRVGRVVAEAGVLPVVRLRCAEMR